MKSFSSIQIYLDLPLLVLVFLLGACGEVIDAPASQNEVPTNPWSAQSDNAFDEGRILYEACASCHMADASGRNDGDVPKLAGQLKSVLVDKLERLRDRRRYLPVMWPFVKTLSDKEIEAMSAYLSQLKPEHKYAVLPQALSSKEAGEAYSLKCSACHGKNGQGNIEIGAPKLCGQHAAYLTRRIHEMRSDKYLESSYLPMTAALTGVADLTIADISYWLSTLKGDEQCH